MFARGVCVLSMHLTPRTTGGGLRLLTGERDVGMLRPPGALQPQTGIVLGASVQRPPSSTTRHTSARQNKLHCQHHPPKQARITSQPDDRVCTHSQRNSASVRDVKGGSEGLITALLLFVLICRPCVIEESKARLSPPPIPKTLQQNQTDSSAQH